MQAATDYNDKAQTTPDLNKETPMRNLNKTELQSAAKTTAMS